MVIGDTFYPKSHGRMGIGKDMRRARVGFISRWFRSSHAASAVTRLFSSLVSSLPRSRYITVALGFATPSDVWSRFVLRSADEAVAWR